MDRHGLLDVGVDEVVVAGEDAGVGEGRGDGGFSEDALDRGEVVGFLLFGESAPGGCTCVRWREKRGEGRVDVPFLALEGLGGLGGLRAWDCEGEGSVAEEEGEDSPGFGSHGGDRGRKSDCAA